MSKKMIAPVVITVLTVIYFIAYIGWIIWLPVPWWIIALGVVIFLAMTCTSILMLIERIKEIRSGEEDDLSQY